MSTLGDTPRPLPKGCALWTPALGSVASEGWDHPPAPSCQGGKYRRVGYGGTSSIPPASGATPWTPLPALQLWGANEHSGGHPQTPAKGLRPLDTCCLPPVIARSGAGSNLVARTIPLAPFLEGRGEQMSTLGDTPRPLPKGCALWTPAASHPLLRGVERRSNLVARTIPLAPFLKGRGEQMSTLGDTPRPLPKGCALWTPAASHRSLRGVERRSNLVARTIPLAPILEGDYILDKPLGTLEVRRLPQTIHGDSRDHL